MNEQATSKFSKAVKVIFAAILVVGLLPLTALTAEAASRAKVSKVGKEYAWDAGEFTNHTHYMELNIDGEDVFAMCCNHLKTTPYEGRSYTYDGEVKNETARKIAYYGWNGVEDKGIGEVITAVCMSNVIGRPGGHGTGDYIYAAEKYVEKFKDYPKTPDTFTLHRWTTGGGYQDLVTWEYNPTGDLDLQKVSANPDLTNGNANYSLQGAQYGVYTDKSCTNKVATITTNASGYGKVEGLDPQTHYVKETKAPNGYALDTKVYTVKIESGETVRVNNGNVKDTPINDPAGILIGKFDGNKTYNGSANLPQGSASLAGAEFTVRYYDGFYDTAEQAEASGAPTRTWVFETNENGFIQLESQYKVSGDELYTILGDATIPRGTLLIQETKAPTGYNLNDEVFIQQVKQPGDTSIVSTYNTPQIPEQVIRGGVSVEKRDLETGELTPQGAASLDGTRFEIKSQNKEPVNVNGVFFSKGQVVATLTIEDGKAATSDTLLPYGDYTIQEVAVGEGYLLTDGKAREFSVEEQGEYVEFVSDDAFFNQVKRGDIELQKKDDLGDTRLAGVPFLITSETTGESHVIVTDANGQLSTSSAWAAHSANTNANDAAVTVEDGKYVVDESKLDPDAGIWFGTSDPNDSLGALIYDTYTIEELPCSANEGLQLVTETGIVISKHNYVVDLGTIDDPQPVISTVATNADDGSKLLVADGTVTVLDKVSYYGVQKGKEYTTAAQLMQVNSEGEATPLTVNGKAVETTVKFTAEATSGTVNVNLSFDALGVTSGNYVVFETLYDNQGRVIAEHKDALDTEQTVTVVTPEIGTYAKDALDGDKNIVADGQETIVDTVAYKNLMPGHEYTYKTTLMLIVDGEATPVSDVITGTFTPDNRDGSFDVEIPFDASKYAGQTLTVYEQVFYGNNLIASHEVPDDEGQTVAIVAPEIGTYASDKVDGNKYVVADNEAVIVDIVTYKGLNPTHEYSYKTALMGFDEDGSAVPVTDADGNPVVIEGTFTPTAADGSFTVEIPFDASKVTAGDKFVVYEQVFFGDTLIASHEDPTDEGQTVEVIQSAIGTAVADDLDGDSVVVADKDASVTDTVSYTNLIPGKEYTLHGILMDKGTGLPLLVGEGFDAVDTAALQEFTDALMAAEDYAAIEQLFADNADLVKYMVVGSASFTPEKADGAAEVAYAFDASRFIMAQQAADTVVFEWLVKGGLIVASHTDIDDVSQTFSIAPSSIGTTASDKTDGDNVIQPSKSAVIVDKVSYENLIPGKEYKVTGVLMDKATGEPLMVGDKQITSSVLFTPNEPDGSIELEFAFDSTGLVGKEIVVFETLTKDGVEVAVHADIEDAAQTVTVEKTPPGKTFDKTGDNITKYLPAVIAAGITAAAAAVYGLRQRKLAKAEAADSENAETVDQTGDKQ